MKNAVNVIGDFERALAAEARRRGVDGVICGHIHHPTIREIDGIAYVNIGDFVESCSLVVEHEDGRARSAALVARAARRRRRSSRRGARRRGRSAPDAHRRRDRRLGPASQWRRSHLERMAEPARELGASNSRSSRREGFPDLPAADLSRKSASPSPAPREVGRRIEASGADHVHIATEGPIGWAARRHCLERGRLFTTSYPHPLSRICARPPRRAGGLELRRAAALPRARRRGAGADGLDSRRTGAARLRQRRACGRAASITRLFRPRASVDARSAAPDLPLCRARRGGEEPGGLLSLDLPGSKVDRRRRPGARAARSAAIPKAHFLGERFGEALAEIYAGADVFVFPSRTDTFGMVLIEALASGLPVAAFPVTGPLDVIGDSGAGALDEDLRGACLAALDISRERRGRVRSNSPGRRARASSSAISPAPRARSSAEQLKAVLDILLVERDEPGEAALQAARLRASRAASRPPPTSARAQARVGQRPQIFQHLARAGARLRPPFRPPGAGAPARRRCAPHGPRYGLWRRAGGRRRRRGGAWRIRRETAAPARAHEDGLDRREFGFGELRRAARSSQPPRPRAGPSAVLASAAQGGSGIFVCLLQKRRVSPNRAIPSRPEQSTRRRNPAAYDATRRRSAAVIYTYTGYPAP